MALVSCSKAIGKLRAQNFDGDDAIQACIGCPVHATHTSGADLRIHDVRPELLPGRKSNVCCIELTLELPSGSIQWTVFRSSMNEEVFDGAPNCGIGPL
jgi:hypothetical protein